MRRMVLLGFLAALGWSQTGPATEPQTTPRQLQVTAGKSLIVDSRVNVMRASVTNLAVAEALAVSPHEILVNGKSPGETSLILWQERGNRLMFDLVVRPNLRHVEAIQRILREELARNDP
jgi:pilus assembly protein CpaC